MGFIFAIIPTILMVGYITYYETLKPPVEFLNEPFPVELTTIKIGEIQKYEVNLCKTRIDELLISKQARLQGGGAFEIPNDPIKLEPDCYEFEGQTPITEQYIDGGTYEICFIIEYDIHPLLKPDQRMVACTEPFLVVSD